MKRSLVGMGLLALILAGCGAAKATSLPRPVSSQFTPTAAQVKAWPAKWCAVQVGMTQQQVEGIMGTPTESFTQGQESWSAFEYQFNAFYNVDGAIRQLDTNDIELSAAEKAALGCAITRR